MAHADANQQKRKQLDDMLNQGSGLVMVHLDPRHEAVQVPPQFRNDPVLRLNLAYGFNLPALDIDDGGVYALLSFGGLRFGCNIPWEAVFALTMPNEEHEGVVWPDDLPPELAPFFGPGDSHRAASEVVGLARVSPPKPEPPALRAVPTPTEGADPEPAADGESEGDLANTGGDSEHPQRPVLRLVK